MYVWFLTILTLFKNQTDLIVMCSSDIKLKLVGGAIHLRLYEHV